MLREIYFLIFVDIIALHKLKYVLWENVKSLASNNGGETWKTILKNIDTLGYYAYETQLILNGLHFDTPQNIERVYIYSVSVKI